PARSPRDTFFFDESRVLRTETSPSQIYALEEHEPPIYMVSIGRVYRRDAITATRYPIFHQFEGLAVDEGITLADLKGTLLHVMRALYGPDRNVRFRTHYFPFTEPSIEPDVSCGICGGEGCRTCKYIGWIEMGGAGVVDPQVFENVGVDPERWSGFAFGGGLELEQRKVRGELSDGMILAEDEVGLGTDHSGIMVLDEGPEPGTPLADVLPLVEEVLLVESTGNRPDLLSVYGVAREAAALQ